MRRLLSAVLLSCLLVTTMVSPAQATGEESTYLVSFRPGASAQALAPVLPSRTRASAQILTKSTQGAIVRLTASEAAALAKNPRVAQVMPDREVRASEVQTPAPWHLDRVDGRQAWQDNTYRYPNSGRNVTVYVMDSGIERTHAEFAGIAVAEGTDTIGGAPTPDCFEHGTAVSSVLAGARYGVAKNVTVVPVRVLNCANRGQASQVWQGIEWIANNHVPGTPAVVNISLGDFGRYLNAPVQGLINQGLVAVVAAGNDGVEACTQTPGSLADAITVAATTRTDQEPSWSNYGSCVDLYAPGSAVRAALPHNQVGPVSGTSFAAPMVSGAAAQVLAQHPDWTPAQVWADIQARATDGVVAGARSTNLMLYVGGLDTFAGDPPQIQGAQTIGSQLTAISRWIPAPTSLTYQWLRAGRPIPGAIDATYTTVPADLNQPLTVVVSGTRQGYAPVRGRSEPLTPVAVSVPGTYRALTPARLLDTRSGLGHAGQVTGGSDLVLPVVGHGGVPHGAAAVVLNLTVTAPTRGGYLTAYAADGSAPTASNLNFAAGETVSNLAVVPLSADGSVGLRYASPGSGHLVADVQGYIVGGRAEQPGTVQLTGPTRLVDTRESQVVPAGGDLHLPLAGRAGMGELAAAVLNVTVVDPGASGYLTVFPDGQAAPTASNLNFVAGQTVPNLVLVKNGANGVVIHNGSAAPVHIVADVQAYVRPGEASVSGAVVAMSPTRVLDTRNGSGALRGQTSTTLPVAQRVQLPAGAPAAVMNVTSTSSQAPGYLTVSPTGQARPTVSNVNVTRPGQTVPNLAFATLGAGSADIYWGSPGSTQVVVDISGYVLP